MIRRFLGAAAMAATRAGVRWNDPHDAAVRVLEDVSLEVRAGETVALLGTNGNGKSTLMKSIMGIVRPSAGGIATVEC